MKNKFSIALSLAVILSILIAPLALADAITADADALVLQTPHPNGVTEPQNGGTTVSYDFSAAIANTGGSGNDVFPGSVSVTITMAGLWLSGGTSGPFTFTAYDAPQAGTIGISVPCGSEGTTETMTIDLQAGTSSNGKSLNPDSQHLSYVITAGPDDLSCAPPSNTAPEVTVDNETVTVNEGNVATNSGTYSDADGDAVTLWASVGTIVDNNDGTWDWSFTTTDGPDDSQTVTITADDGQAQSSATFDLAVNNVAPTADFLANSPVDEGSPFTLSLSNAFDPSSVDAAQLKYAFDCGDGAGYGAFGISNTASCSTIDNGTLAVGGKIQDKDGGENEYIADVAVDNVVPIVAAPSWNPASVACRTPATLTGISFSDAGVIDYPWNVNIDWGDTSADTNYQTNTQGTQDNQLHTYNVPGTYTATVGVTDKDTGYGSAQSGSLTVLQTYTINFLQPFDGSSPSQLITNTMKSGRVVPVKVTIYDDCAQAYVTDPTMVVKIWLSAASTTGASNDAVEVYADAGASNGNTLYFRWTSDSTAPGGGFWIYNFDSRTALNGSALTINMTYRIDVFVGTVKATASKWALLKPVK